MFKQKSSILNIFEFECNIKAHLKATLWTHLSLKLDFTIVCPDTKRIDVKRCQQSDCIIQIHCHVSDSSFPFIHELNLCQGTRHYRVLANHKPYKTFKREKEKAERSRWRKPSSQLGQLWCWRGWGRLQGHHNCWHIGGGISELFWP